MGTIKERNGMDEQKQNILKRGGKNTQKILEKEMATHSSILAWRIPGMGDPGGLPSLGLHRVGHD